MTNDIAVRSPFGAVAERETAGAKQSQSRELAETQTLYLMAERMPRDERSACEAAIRQFERQGLAERAEFSYRRGNETIAGPTIRTAEAIAQKWGNIKFGFREVARGIGADGVPFSEVEAFAVDLQSRVPRTLGFIVPHWRDTQSGGYRLKTERDIYELVSNQAQRRVRSCILALIPGDVVEACMQQADQTLKANVDMTAAGVDKILKAFEPYGVTRKHIEKAIDRGIESLQPGHVIRLRKWLTSIKEGVADVSELFDMADSAADKVNAAADAAGFAPKPAPAPIARAKPKADAPAPRVTYAQLADKVQQCPDESVAEFVVDEAVDAGLPDDQVADLRKLIATKFATTKDTK